MNSARPRFGAILRQLRLAARLTQGDLAERSRISVDAISTLESGRRLRPHSSTVNMLADGLGLVGNERDEFVAAARMFRPATGRLTSMSGRDALPDRAPLPAGSRMPLAPNPLFVGRNKELLQMATALRGGDTTVALGQVVAATGLGGLGKTQLAVEFVHRFGRYFEGGVFWLSFASADEIPLQVAACAGSDAMDLAPGIEGLSLEERVKRVQRAWQGADPRILVFDNCEEESLLEAWRPSSGGCRVLVTSRRAQWSPTLGVTTLPLDLLPRADSVELLRRYQPDLVAADRGLDAIAHELGDLPLALHLAGSYLRAYSGEVSLDTYLAELRRSEVVDHASLLGRGLEDAPNPTHHVQGVAQTFALCLGRLDREREVDRVAIALLARTARMAPGEPVPRDLLARTLEDVDPLLRADGVRRLAAVGLVEEGEGWLRLHRLLVHFVRQEGLDPMAQTSADRALIGCGEDAEQGHLTGSALAATIPHLIVVASDVGIDKGGLELAAELAIAAGQALQYAGNLRAARPWYERAVAIRKRVLGPDHPDTATSLSNLARLLYHQGELATARGVYECAVAIRERVLGPDHPDTAEGLNDLGLVLWAQGELTAARAFYERALAIWERVRRPDRPRTALGLNDLSQVTHGRAELAAARPHLERALATRERELGPDHTDTAQALNDLGLVLWAQGELAAAEPLLESALASYERLLGPNHPMTARGLNNLGVVLRDQGELAAARPLLERALHIRESVLGRDHPETAYSLNVMGRLLRAEGQLAAARSMFERALDIRERVLGPDHPRTAQMLNDLAVLLRDQGDPTAARSLFERALAIRERVLGSDHSDTVATRHALELAAETGGAAAEE